MIKSRYLEKQIEKNNEIKMAQAKKTLISVIILAIVAVIAYIGISSSDSRATSVAIMFSSALGLICFIFLIKFFKLRSPINEKAISKCEQEIKKHLKLDETFETFDQDMEHPAFGEHIALNCTVIVGRTFILFKGLNSTNPKFEILRGDILGDFKVYYSSQAGTTEDVGMDLKDKNGKFIRSIMSPDKKSFYKLLNAMEKLKHCTTDNNSAMAEASASQDDPFVEETKSNIARIDKKASTKLAIVGVVVGLFLTIAGNSSGVAFIYAGLALLVISIAAIIFINAPHK